MEQPTLTELISILGPTGGFFAYWYMFLRGNKEKSGPDPLHELEEAMRKEMAELRKDNADLRREISAVREIMAGMKATLEAWKDMK